MIKYIRLASDLHLEQYLGTDMLSLAKKFLTPDEHDADSILVLAGDISSHPIQIRQFIEVIQSRFAKIIFFAGNHEYYGHDYDKWYVEMEKLLLDLEQGKNLHFSSNGIGTSHIENNLFIYGTLWGDGGFKDRDRADVSRGLRDFYVIQKDGHRRTVTDMIKQNTLEKNEIARILQTVEGKGFKTIVATHHLPSRRLVSERFLPRDGTDGLNGGFCASCDDILAADWAPNIWLHGHTHDTIRTRLWKTDIYCNPSGYYFEHEKGPYNLYGPMFIEL